jgi:ketosteroid isomerase-like protein
VEEAAPRRLDDRSLLVELQSRYARFIDDGDLEGVVGCFTEDAVADYDDGAVRLRGQDQLRRFFAAAFEDLVGPRHPCSHLVGGLTVELDGDSAGTETSAVAYLTRSPGLLLVRGLRYSDKLLRGADGWRIARRRHYALWQVEMPASSGAQASSGAVGGPGSARTS